MLTNFKAYELNNGRFTIVGQDADTNWWALDESWIIKRDAEIEAELLGENCPLDEKIWIYLGNI